MTINCRGYLKYLGLVEQVLNVAYLDLLLGPDLSAWGLSTPFSLAGGHLALPAVPLTLGSVTTSPGRQSIKISGYAFLGSFSGIV